MWLGVITNTKRNKDKEVKKISEGNQEGIMCQGKKQENYELIVMSS